MMQQLINLAKANLGKGITIASIIAAFGLYTAATQLLDQRYCLASDAKQTQQTIDTYIKADLENKIFIIEMLEQRNQATDIDIAMKKRYLRQLNPPAETDEGR